MITPWEIYWVLQLDSIGNLLDVFLIIGILLVAGLTLFGCVNLACSKMYPQLEMSKREGVVGRALLRVARRLVYIVVPVFVLAAFLPSTKTAAAMIIVPQIVNSPTIQHEAGDLYKLAKEALRDAIAPKPSK